MDGLLANYLTLQIAHMEIIPTKHQLTDDNMPRLVSAINTAPWIIEDTKVKLLLVLARRSYNDRKLHIIAQQGPQHINLTGYLEFSFPSWLGLDSWDDGCLQTDRKDDMIYAWFSFSP